MLGSRPAVAFPGLFRKGARWTFALRYQHDGDDAGPPARSKGGCRVIEVVDFDGGQAAEVGCDEGLGEAGDASRNPLPGVWAETAHGLYKLDSLPAPGERLVPVDDERWIALPAVASTETIPESPDDEVHEERSHTTTIEADGAAWCRDHVYGATFGWSERVCLDARGPVSGGWTWETLEIMHTTTFSRAR